MSIPSPHPRQDSDGIVNALSVDVEDYFHVGAFESVIARDRWDSFESRVETNTHRLLELFSAADVKATMFVLGWVAERFPGLVRDMQSAGHELAIHGYDHRRLTTLTVDEFKSDIRRSRALVEDISGTEVVGYRAPNYSMVRNTLWASEILLEEGFLYDSSIFPTFRGRTGIPNAPRHPWVIQQKDGRRLHEFPVSTVRILGVNVPFVGGAYLRQLPLSYIEWGMRRVNRRERLPAMVYVHPWEIDPEQPVQPVSMLTRIRHYRNLDETYGRLTRLFRDFQFTTVRRVLGV